MTKTPVSEIADNGTIGPVPSGDVWMGTWSVVSAASSNGDITLNGTTVGELNSGMPPGENFQAPWIFDSGEDASINVQGTIYFNGFEVSDELPYTVVTEQIGTSSSLSPPSGETWKGTLFLGTSLSSNSRHDWNGTRIFTGTNGEAEWGVFEVVMTDADTVSTDGAGYAAFSGWKI